MKPPLTQFTRRRATHGRLRLASALLLLALPLAVAVWSLGDFAARRARNNADRQLAGAVARSLDAYQTVPDVTRKATARAGKLAGSEEVQRAFRKGPAAIAKVQRRYPGILFLRGASGGAIPPAAAVHQFDVSVRGRTIGRVIVLTPLDRSLLARLARGAPLGTGRHLAFFDGRRLLLERGSAPVRTPPPTRHAADLDIGATTWRVYALPLATTQNGELLVGLEPASRIDAAADRARWRAVGVGLALIAALLALSYAAAPWIARSRVTRQQRDQAARVLARLGDGVVVVDNDGIVRLWNQAAEAITGLRAAEVLRRPAGEAIPGWATIAALVPVASGPGQSEEISSVETVPVEVEGRELWLSMVGVTLADGTVYAFRDATDERRLEDLRSQFVATISHELRTPLASLHGAALTLREHGGDLSAHTQEELLDMIAQQSKRMAGLVEEILVAGQLDSGSLRVQAEPFDPEELVRGAAMTARARLGAGAEVDALDRGSAAEGAGRRRADAPGAARTCSTTPSSTRPREAGSSWGPPPWAGASASPCTTRVSGFPPARRNGSSRSSTGSIPTSAPESAEPGSASTSAASSCAPWAAGSGSSPSPTAARSSASSYPPRNGWRPRSERKLAGMARLHCAGSGL